MHTGECHTLSKSSLFESTLVFQHAWDCSNNCLVCSSEPHYLKLQRIILVTPSHASCFILIIVLYLIPHWIPSPGSERLFPLLESQHRPRLNGWTARECKGIVFLIFSNLELRVSIFFSHVMVFGVKSIYRLQFFTWTVREWMDEFNNILLAFVAYHPLQVQHGRGIMIEAVVLRFGETDPSHGQAE